MKLYSNYRIPSNLLSASAGLMLATLSATAFADEIRLGQPSYGGNGCPAGSASATLSPDQSQLSILFDSFQVEAGNRVGKRLDRKSCQIAVPVHVPQGISVSVLKMDYRGFNALPQGARSQFNVEYFFAGSQGPKYTKDFYGSNDSDFTITNELTAAAVVWSACGQEVNLRTNANMLVETNAFGEQASSTLDSIDIEAGVIYKLQWKTCGQTNPGPNPNPIPIPPNPTPIPPNPNPYPNPYPTPAPYPTPGPGYGQCLGNICVGDRVLYKAQSYYGQTQEEASVLSIGNYGGYNSYASIAIRLFRTGQTLNVGQHELISLTHRGAQCSTFGICVNQQVSLVRSGSYAQPASVVTFDENTQMVVIRLLSNQSILQVHYRDLTSGSNGPSQNCGLGFCVGDRVTWVYSRMYDRSAQVIAIDQYRQKITIRANANGASYSVSPYELQKSYF